MAITLIDSAKNASYVVGSTGVVVTHGMTIADNDVLLALNGCAFTNLSAFASTGFDVVPSSYLEAVAGNDRTSALLTKVGGGSEPSSYTFTRTGDTQSNSHGVLIAQLRGVDTANIIDAGGVGTDAQNTFTPNPPDVTTVTDDAMTITTLVMVNAGAAEDLAAMTVVAPSGFTLIDSQIGTDASTDFDVLVAMAYRIEGAAGAKTVGAWQNTGGNAAWDSIVTTLAIRAASTSPGGATVPTFIGGGWWG